MGSCRLQTVYIHGILHSLSLSDNISGGAAESVPYAKRTDYIAHNNDFLVLLVGRLRLGRLQPGDLGECGRFKVATSWVQIMFIPEAAGSFSLLEG